MQGSKAKDNKQGSSGLQSNQHSDNSKGLGFSKMLSVNAEQLEAGNKMINEELVGGRIEPDVSFVLWIMGNNVHLVQTGDDNEQGPKNYISMQKQGSRNDDKVHMF